MAEAIGTGSGVDIDKLEADFQADPGNFVPLARAYLERGLPQQAIHACKRGLRSNPNAPSGLLALGMSYYLAYEDQKAEVVLKKVLRATPDSYTAHRALGEIFLDRGQDEKALNELSRALEIEPRDRHTRALLESLEEQLPALKSPDGQPEDSWPPRREPVVEEPPKPIWRTIAQLVVVAAVVASLIFWYQHHVDIRVEISDYVKKATTLIPRDNFDDLTKAEKLLESAYALDEDEEKVIVRLAAVSANLWKNHAQQDRLEKLKKYSEWMEEEDLPNPERFASRALFMVDNDEVEQADKFLTETIERAIEKKDIFLDATVFGARARARLKMGQIKEAREDYSRAARFSSESPHYQAAFANVYMREGNKARAIKYFSDALRANPAHIFSSLRKAYVHILQGKNFEQAEKIITDMLSDKHTDEEFSPPMDGLRYLVKAEYELAKENVPEASKWLRKSLETYDDSAEAHNLAGRLAAMNRDGTKARAEFAKALQLDPRLPRVYFDRAESVFQLGEKTEAIEKLREFERHLEPTVAYHVKAGQLYMRMDDLEAAISEFKKAVDVDELSPQARFHVALCHQTRGAKLGDDKDKKEEKLQHYNEARKWYEDTLVLPGGELPEVYHMMGRIYLDSEDPNNALDNLAKSAMMMQKAKEPGKKVAVVYFDIAKVFDYLGGPEGEKQAEIYRWKAKGLAEGKTMEEVEKEAAEMAKKEKKKKRRRRRRRRRR